MTDRTDQTPHLTPLAGSAAPPLEVVLIRHGSTGARWSGRFVGSTDLPLSPTGRGQATALSQAVVLARRSELSSVHGYFASPLRRVRETAKLALPDTVTIEYDDDLREIDYGQWEGLTFAEIVALAPDKVDGWARLDPAFAFPSGESFADFTARVRRVAARVAAQRGRRERLVLFTHGGMARALICHWLGLSPAHYLLFEVGNASVSTVRLFITDRAEAEGGGPAADDGFACGVLIGLNDRHHLEEE